MLMGDAGSRALGVFLALLALKTNSPFVFIPLTIVLIIDGGMGLIKVSFIRFLKLKNFMKNIRTPIHDHVRKNKGWSDTQVVTRFSIVQIIICICYYMICN
jgi:phospho-N-acetylmuramoyl-pentapeptide-transferase